MQLPKKKCTFLGWKDSRQVVLCPGMVNELQPREPLSIHRVNCVRPFGFRHEMMVENVADFGHPIEASSGILAGFAEMPMYPQCVLNDRLDCLAPQQC